MKMDLGDSKMMVGVTYSSDITTTTPIPTLSSEPECPFQDYPCCTDQEY